MKAVSQTYGVGLTRREKEVLSYIADGLTSRQIADKLFISEYTVANHRKNMFAKMGVHNSDELAEKNLRHFFN